MSNHDLIEWWKYLNIPIKDVLSRDQTVPRDHRQALFICNLEPSYMSGSHWVATYVKDGVTWFVLIILTVFECLRFKNW